MKSRNSAKGVWCFLLLLSVCAAGHSAPPPEPDAPAPKPAATAAQISQWITDLDSDRFVTRDEASVNLVAAGKAAIEPLANALASDSREVALRATEIIKKIATSAERDAQVQARAALDRLADSDDVKLAARAKEALATLPREQHEQPGPPAIPGLQFGGGIRIGPGGQINFLGGARSVRVSNVNGRKTIDADEEGRKIHIEEEQPGHGIKMTIVEPGADKDKPTKIEAQDVADLKKQNAKAAELYQQYTGDLAGGVNLQLGGVAMQQMIPRGVRGGRGMRGQFPLMPNDRQEIANDTQDAKQLLSKALVRLRKQAEERADDAELRKALEQLDEAAKKLDKALRQLSDE